VQFHRFAALLLGAWLAGCLFMDLVATGNFRSVDRALAAPPAQFAQEIQAFGGHDTARIFLRHLVSEQNRQYFAAWEQVQIVLGAALFLVLVFGTDASRLALLLALLMLAFVLVMHFFLTPEITRLGRAIDFVPPGAPSGERTRFWVFHGAYSASELLKLGLGIVLAVLVVRGRKKLQPAQIDAVRVNG
jgi:hypothetical protein